MPLWMSALLGLVLFAIGLAAFLWRRGSRLALAGLVLMVQGDLLFTLSASAHLGQLQTRGLLLLLLALLPLEVLGAWFLWRRLSPSQTDDPGGEEHDG